MYYATVSVSVCVYIQVYAYYKDLYVVQQQRSAYARGGFYNIII